MQTNMLISKRWLAVAIGALMAGGILSIILVVGRVPYINSVISDPNFAKKCLIVHVNLTIFVWFSAFIASLFNLSSGWNKSTVWRGLLVIGATSGLILLTAALFANGSEPVLSNYIPVLNHFLFFAGLGIFATCVGLIFIDGRLWWRKDTASLPEPALLGVRFATAAVIIADITFIISWFLIDKKLPADIFYEMLFWGAGHVLQFAHIFAMLAVWIVLIEQLTGGLFLSGKIAAVLYSILFLPITAAPFWATQITDQGTYYLRFTQLMQWGIFPVVSVFIVLAVHHLWMARHAFKTKSDRKPASPLSGFAAAVLLIITGFVFGALIEGADTMVPAHYHAAIGAVTVSFMTMTYVLLQKFGLQFPSPKLQRLADWQPLLYGFGQFLLASGLAYARMLRKIYGEEQIVHSFSQKLGLGIMGIGGLLAVSGGVMFIWIALRVMLNKKTQPAVV